MAVSTTVVSVIMFVLVALLCWARLVDVVLCFYPLSRCGVSLRVVTLSRCDLVTVSRCVLVTVSHCELVTVSRCELVTAFLQGLGHITPR